MPRPHTPRERELIRERLLEAGRQGFPRLGLAKITIADLARDAGIGKGTFYQFFDSKEELFLAVQEREEATFKSALFAELDQAESGRDAVRRLLLAVATRLDAHPFLKLLLDPETMAALTLRVPPERLAVHRHEDAAVFIGLLRDWQKRGWLRPDLDPHTAFEVLTAMFLLTTQRGLMGDGAMQRALTELADALAERWCP